MRRLITLFLETTPSLLEQMRAALESLDRGALGMAAHTLRGSLVQFGEERARALTIELEGVASHGAWTSAPALLEKLASEIARFETELKPHLRSAGTT